MRKRGKNDDGRDYYPAIIVDGHVSRMGLSLLKYVNAKRHRWRAILVCPYGTSKTQFQDDEKQNGGFKCALYASKRVRIRKRREHGLPADFSPEKIPIIVKEALDASYADKEYAE